MAALDAHPTITEHEYISKLRVWKESTSTSPSGLHLEHYKALIARHAYSDIDNAEDELRAEWNNMQSCLLTYIACPDAKLRVGTRVLLYTMAHSG